MQDLARSWILLFQDNARIFSWVGQVKGGVRVGQGKGGVMSGTGKRWGHEWDREKVGS